MAEGKPAVLNRLQRNKYLGYGVHVGFDPVTEEFVIWTLRGEFDYHFIHMTPTEIRALQTVIPPYTMGGP